MRWICSSLWEEEEKIVPHAARGLKKIRQREEKLTVEWKTCLGGKTIASKLKEEKNIRAVLTHASVTGEKRFFLLREGHKMKFIPNLPSWLELIFLDMFWLAAGNQHKLWERVRGKSRWKFLFAQRAGVGKDCSFGWHKFRVCRILCAFVPCPGSVAAWYVFLLSRLTFADWARKKMRTDVTQSGSNILLSPPASLPAHTQMYAKKISLILSSAFA